MDIFNDIGLEKDKLYLLVNSKFEEKIDSKDRLEYDFIKSTDNYYYHFNLDRSVLLFEHTLSFKDKKNNPNNFIECLLDILTSTDEKYLVLKDDILLADYRESILKINCLNLTNMCLDKIYLELILKYFKKIQCIRFGGCNIKSDCDFSDFKCELVFSNCTIENINSLNSFSSDIYLIDNIIKRLYPTTIYSKSVKIKNMNDTELFNFLSVCQFPLTNSLIIENNSQSYVIDDYLSIIYKKSLIILTYSCPNIESLTIYGSIYSTDFLYRLKNIKEVLIKSIDDSIGVYEIINPNIISSTERENIKNKYKNTVGDEINPNLSSRISMHKAVEDIIKSINNFRYSSQERECYFGNKNPIININEQSSNQFLKYYYVYDSIYKTISFKTQYDTFRDGYNRTIIKNCLITRRKNYTISELIKIREDIPISQKIIYNAMSIPIIFEKDFNPGYDVSYDDTIKESISQFDCFATNKYDDSDDDINNSNNLGPSFEAMTRELLIEK